MDGESEDVVAEVVGCGEEFRVGRVWAGPPGQGWDVMAVEVVHEGIAVVAEDRKMEWSVVCGRGGQGGLAVRRRGEVVGEKLVVGSASGSVLAPVVVGAEAQKSRVGRKEEGIWGGRNLILGWEAAIGGQTFDRGRGESGAYGAEALAGEGAEGRWG